MRSLTTSEVILSELPHTHVSHPKGAIMSAVHYTTELVTHKQRLPHTKQNAVHQTFGAGEDVTWLHIMSSCSGADDEGGVVMHLCTHSVTTTQSTLATAESQRLVTLEVKASLVT